MRALSPEDLVRLRTPGDPQVSPDGSRVAFVLTEADRERDRLAGHIWVAGAEGSSLRQWTRGDSDAAPRWSPDGTLLAFLSSRARGEPAQPHILAAEGGEARRLTELRGGVEDLAWSPDGQRLVVVASVSPEIPPAGPDHDPPLVINRGRYKADGVGFLGERRSHLFIVDVATGDARQLTSGDFSAATPAWSPDGRHLAFCSAMHDERDIDAAQHLFVVDAAGGDPVRVTGGTWLTASPVWTRDGERIVFAGVPALTDPQNSLYAVAHEGGDPEPLLPGFDRTVLIGATGYPGGRPALNPEGDAVLFCARIGGCTHLYECSLRAAGEPRALVNGATEVVQGLSVAAHAARAALVVSTPESPGDVAVVDLDHPEVRRLTDLNRTLLDEVEVARPELRTFTASDGVAFEAWVWGAQPGTPKPLLLNIHGGPHNAWTPALSSFELHQQQLVADGWCIVAPNPRGSDGYGSAFMRAVIGGWGLNDERDFMAAVDALVATGVADADRLAVTGYSYGGYMTAWLAGHSDCFRAAVAGGVVTNLASVYGTSDLGGFMADAEFGTDPHADPALYARMSPITYVDSMHVPMLIQHGAGDDRCDLGQAEELFTALRRLHRDVELVVYPGASHVFVIAGRPSQQVAYQRRLLDWIRSHVPAAASQASDVAEREPAHPRGERQPA